MIPLPHLPGLSRERPPLYEAIQSLSRLGASSLELKSVKSTAGQTFNVMSYGAKGDGVSDDTLAIDRTIAAAEAGPTAGWVWLPPGFAFVTMGNHQITRASFVGGGHGRTLIKLEHPTNHLVNVVAGLGNRDDISFGGFTVDTTTTVRTGGRVFRWLTPYNSGEVLRRARLFDVVMLHQFSGILMSTYEYCWVEDCLYDLAPAPAQGAIAFQFGQTAATNINQGSELYVVNCQANNRSSSANTLGYGFWFEDCDAVYLDNCGAIASLNSFRVTSNAHPCANYFFSNCVADSTTNTTTNNHSFWVKGTGAVRFRFANCWFASAGQGVGGGGGIAAVDGLHIDTGALSYSTFAGCFFGNCGQDGLHATSNVGLQFVGCTFGGAAGSARYGAHLTDVACNMAGCEFDGNIAGGLFVNGTNNANLQGHFSGNVFYNAVVSWQTTATSARTGFVGNYFIVAPVYGVAPGLNANNVTY